VPVADGEPGVECQIDFARMGLIDDPETGRRRVVHALIVTAVYSRHMFVWLTFATTLEAIIAGCEAAWRFFGGVFKVLVPDNMKPIVAQAPTQVRILHLPPLLRHGNYIGARVRNLSHGRTAQRAAWRAQ
jgi:transposase